ncbi:uncharacterized protein Nmlp_3053 [Natronomonas moolapensis 8.8.11]|uniref:Uncharacterized protein n=1 Tax=Natronomonas moolapensis (strain DSM 18674 / CECT 7526 / JCM 14361 / 8.8.11) TaxID=268739 RepID=M1Y3U0_NATM8|nr:uncharacterized protein Nmlp_3053 [Natronomonas moolapensis 8.8.11]
MASDHIHSGTEVPDGSPEKPIAEVAVDEVAVRCETRLPRPEPLIAVSRYPSVAAVADRFWDEGGDRAERPGKPQQPRQPDDGVGFGVRGLSLDDDHAPVVRPGKATALQQFRPGLGLERPEAESVASVHPEQPRERPDTEVTDAVEEHDRSGVGLGVHGVE